MNKVVLGFSGPVGSGKSEVAKGLSAKLGWPRIGFGDHVRSLAAERKLEPTREVLQNIGESEVSGNCENFCRSVLLRGSWSPDKSVIIDGVRHLAVIETITKITQPSQFLLIYLDISDLVQAGRLAKRGVSPKELKTLESHSTEIQVKVEIKKRADFLLSTEGSVSDAVDAVLAWLRTQKYLN